MFWSVVLLTSPSLAVEPASSALRALEDIQLSHSITLDDPGAAPRRVVRFVPRPGAGGSYEVVTKQEMGMSLKEPDGSAMELPGASARLPTTILSMKNEVGQPLAGGLVPVWVEHLSARVEGGAPDVTAAMAQGLRSVEGLRFRLLVDPAEGKIVQADASSPDAAMFEAAQSMADQLVTQMPSFPSEPVGVGASWTVDLEMGMSGLELRTIQTVRLVELTDEHVVLDTKLTFQEGDEPMVPPGLPPGADIELLYLKGSGKGTMRTELDTMISSGAIDVALELAMRVTAAGQAMEMGMKMTQHTETRPAR